MLIVFKAKRCADVTMPEDNGREILALLGKDRAADRGVVTVEQMPAAIASLARATRHQRLHRPDAARQEAGDAELDSRDDRVQLFQRARPVKRLLDQALYCRSPVTWGS